MPKRTFKTMPTIWKGEVVKLVVVKTPTKEKTCDLSVGIIDNKGKALKLNKNDLTFVILNYIFNTSQPIQDVAKEEILDTEADLSRWDNILDE